MLKDSVDCYSYLVVGQEKALLFDTGCGADDLKTAVKSITDLPVMVILSHGHFDHIGGSLQFEEAYMSEKDRIILKDYNDELLNRWIKEMQPDGQEAAAHPPFIRTEGWKHIKNLDFTSFDLGNLQGIIVELPGHSAGSIGVFFPQLRLLLSGDALSPIMCLIFLNHGDKKEQLASLQKILDYDFDFYYTAHSSTGYPKELLYRMISCIEQSTGKRHHKYRYPKPPYSEGYFYLHSFEEEPVGLIVQEQS